MKKFILGVVSGELEEWNRIALLLTMGFFNGIFLATYDVATTSLFLETFKDSIETMLAVSMVGAGILGILSAVTISFLQQRYSYQRLAVGMLAFFAAVVSMVAVALQFSHDKVFVFLAHIIIGPTNAVVVLIFWGVFGRIFQFRSAKRLGGGIDSGQAIATILGLFTIPFIEPLLSEVSVFLLGSAVCLVATTFALFYITRNFPFTESRTVASTQLSSTIKGSANLTENPYARVMALFVVCSALAASFAEYTFLSTASEKFTDQSSLTQFLSFFGATVIIASFLVQTFLNDLIIEMFGLKVSLMFLPFILLVFTISAVAVGLTFGHTAKGAGDTFLIFFVVVSLGRLFVDALRDSLESPTVKQFFFPLDISIRFSIQTKIEGVVNQSAALIAGLVIVALETFKFFDLIDCQYMMVVIIAVWVYATVVMYKGYSATLSNTLNTTKGNKVTGEDDHLIPRLLTKELRSSEGVVFKLALGVSLKVDPLLAERYLCQFLQLNSSEKQRYALSQILERRLFEAMPDLKQYVASKSAYSEQANLVLQTLEELRQQAKTGNYLQTLARSSSTELRIEACRLLTQHLTDENFKHLTHLMRDAEPDVRRAAFITVGKLQIEEFLPMLIDQMSNVGYENTAVSAILNYGEKALMALEASFYKSGQKQNAMINVVQIYGLIGGAKAIELLLRKTDFPDKRIAKEVLYSLNFSNWTASGNMTAFIKNVLEQAIGNTLWSLVALNEIKGSEGNHYLKKALQELIAHQYEEIFLLLSTIYDKDSVKLVMNNVKNGTADSIGYAIELLNVFMDDELKPLIIPIIDDISTEEKLKKLENIFSRDKFTEVEVLEQIINREYNAIDRWVRVCALHSFAMHKETNIANELVSNIFNPDELVQETASWGVCLQSRDLYDYYCQRLNPARVRELNRIVLPAVAKGDDGTLLSMEKVIFLYKVPLLEGVSGVVLSEMIEWMEESYFPSGSSIPFENEFGHEQIIFIRSGRVEVQSNGEHIATFAEYDSISLDLTADDMLDGAQLQATEDLYVYVMLSERFYELMGDHYELTVNVLKNIYARIATQAPQSIATAS